MRLRKQYLLFICLASSLGFVLNGELSLSLKKNKKIFLSCCDKIVGSLARMSIKSKQEVVSKDIMQLIEFACSCYDIDASKIHVCYATSSLKFSHCFWGNTLFINEEKWSDYIFNEKVWAIFHELAHYKQNDYGSKQVERLVVLPLSCTAGSVYLYNKIDVNRYLYIAAMIFGSYQLAKQYVSFIIDIENDADMLAIETLIENDLVDVVQYVYEQYEYELLHSDVERPEWCFPTWKQSHINMNQLLYQKLLENDNSDFSVESNI